jgi:thioredoxin-like negative regulator of GroEL
MSARRKRRRQQATAGGAGSGGPPRTRRRGGRRLWIAGGAAAAAIVLFAVLGRWPGRSGSGPASPTGVERPVFVAPDEIDWPPVAPAKRQLFEEGRRLLFEAAVAYGGGDRVSGDERMLAALRRLGEAGAAIPALRAYHEETLEAPLRSRDYAEVERRARLWLDNFPEDANALEALVEAAQRRGRWADGARAARELTRVVPGHLEGWLALASFAFEQVDKEGAVAAVRRALGLIGFPGGEFWTHPGASKVLGTSVKVLHRFQEYEELARVAAAHRRHFPGMVEVVMAEGIARLHTGDAAGAEPLLRDALADPANANEVRFHLALALSKQGKHAEAARVLAALLAEEPHFGRAYYQLGMSLVRLGRDGEAEAMLEKSRELAPSEREMRREAELRSSGQPARAAFARSQAYLLRGQPGEAEKALRAPELRSHPAVLVPLAELYLDWLRLEEAEAELALAAMALGADHQDILGNRALALWHRGRRDEALAALTGLCERPGTARVWVSRLARLHLELGQPARAKALLEPVRRGADDREESLLLGQAHLALGGAERALELFESVSRGDTRWDEWQVNIWLARALLGAGREPGAAWKLIEETPARKRGTLLDLEARREALERLASSDPAFSPLALEEARAALERARSLAPRLEALRRRIAQGRWPAAGREHLDLARNLAAAGNRGAALHHARLALEAEPAALEPRRQLAEWLDGEAEAFIRLRLLREISAIAPDDAGAARELRALEEKWGLRADAQDEPAGLPSVEEKRNADCAD